MNEERTHILQMLANGKISVNEAMSLLEALERGAETAASEPLQPLKRSRRQEAQAPDRLIDQVLRLRDHGVDREYIAAMKETGFENLDAEQLVRMKMHGVTAQFVDEVRGAGFEQVTPEQLVRMAMHNVSAEFIQEMREATSRDLTIEQLIKLRIHDVDAEVFAEMMSLGLLEETPSPKAEPSLP